MRVFAIGRNYAEHIKELENERPTEPVVFIKSNRPIKAPISEYKMPGFTTQLHHEVELVLKFGQGFAPGRFKELDAFTFSEITIGLDFTDRDLQTRLKKEGLPWEKAKSFDGATILGTFKTINLAEEWTEDLNFSLEVNEEVRQLGNPNLMIFTLEQQVRNINTYFGIEAGDVLFTGTPAGVGPIQAGDRLVAKLRSEEMIRFSVVS